MTAVNSNVAKVVRIAILFVILTAGWWIKPGEVEEIPLCLFKWFLGLDCPGCGLTRSILSVASGHFGEAFSYNAAGPLLYILFLVYLVESFIGLVKKGYRVNLPGWISHGCGLMFATLLFGHWVWRLIRT